MGGSPLAVVCRVACNPTLQVVAAIGGENFTRREIVCEMCHSMYRLSLSYTHIIPHSEWFVNPFFENNCKQIVNARPGTPGPIVKFFTNRGQDYPPYGKREN